jgi:hypothetical protein
LVAPDGRVWIPRTRAAGDDVQTYDVFDSAGRVAERVRLAPRSHIVGFSAKWIYVARVDADDLEYLSRVPTGR